MTEADVAAVEQEVVGVSVDPEVERLWAERTRAVLRQAEQRLMAEWKMWKFVRDDARMQSALAELRRVRACLAYLATVSGLQGG